MLNRELIERIIEANDIVEVIGEYVDLKKVGKNYRALCPFHVEKTPSFYVSPEKQLYHCFGCKAGGNVITFIMNYERIGFMDAVKKLAERAGIRIEGTRITGPEEKLYKALEFAKNFYVKYLWSSEGREAQVYLFSRDFSKDTLEYFAIGFVPMYAEPLLREASKNGIEKEVLVEAGILYEGEDYIYPWLKGRIVFPIMNSAGRVIGFGGRTIKDEEPKYINSPETPLFKKRKVLYGFDKAKNGIRRDGAMLVEGYFDVIRLHSAGIDNAVAPLGTSFTEEQAQVLRRYNQRIYLLFDGDESGIKAAKRAVEVSFSAGLSPAIILLPPNEDPDSYLRKYSKEDFVDYISRNLLDPVDFIIKIEKPNTVDDKVRVIKKMKNMLSLLSDDVLRELYATKFAEEMRIKKELLLVKKKEMEKLDKKIERKIPTKEERFLKILICNPEYIEVAKNILKLDYVKDEFVKTILEKLYKGGEKMVINSLLEEVDEKERQILTEWIFEDFKVKKEEFEGELLRYVNNRKKEILLAKIEEAEMQGEEDLVEKMVKELNRLVRHE